MNDRDIDIIRQAKAYERIISADPHRRHPARGNDIGQLKRRRSRRNGKRNLRNWARDWR